MRSFGSPLLNHASVSAVTYSLLHNVGLSKTKMPSFSKWGSREIVTTCLKDSDEITGVGNKMLKDTRKKKKDKKKTKRKKNEDIRKRKRRNDNNGSVNNGKLDFRKIGNVINEGRGER